MMTRLMQILTLNLFCWLCTTHLHSQAFCALRDPLQTIRTSFPEADGFASSVVTFSPKQAAALTSESGLSVDPREFGQHTIYSVTRQGKLLGYAQSRSELSDWGIAEIVCTFTSDLKVLDFHFQRCREPNRASVESDSFRTLVRGRTEAELVLVLKTLESGSSKTRESGDLLATVVKALIKSAIVHRLSFSRSADLP